MLFWSTPKVPLFPIIHEDLDLGLALPLTNEKKSSFWQPGPGLVHKLGHALLLNNNNNKNVKDITSDKATCYYDEERQQLDYF